MSAIRRLKHSNHQNNNSHFGHHLIVSNHTSHFHSASKSMDLEKEILQILTNVTHIKGKSLYQAIAELKNEAQPSRPLRNEINQVIWKLFSDQKISLAEHPEKRGIKYSTIHGFKKESFNPRDAELLVEIVNNVPSSTWLELGQAPELGRFRNSLCHTVAKIRADKVKILSHKQCYWALEALKFAIEQAILDEDWAVESLSIDYTTLSVLLADLRHFQS